MEATDSIDADSPANESSSESANGPVASDESSESVPSAEADAPVGETATEPVGAPAPQAAETPMQTPDTTTSPTPHPVIANGRYMLQSVQSHRCMDVPSGKNDNEWQLQVYDCSDTNPNQLMTIEFIERNYYRVVTANKKNLEGKKDNLKAGSPFIQNQPTGAANQQFSFEATGTASIYILKLRDQDLVVDVAGGQTANSSKLQLAPNKSQDNQKWLLISLP